MHIALEKDIASFLGTEDSIIYSQGFSTISSVIPAFSKRGDIIVADRGVNFAIQKGIQMSRSTVRWYDHNDLKSLEDVLESVDKEAKKKRWPLTRRFIITEGIFETDGEMIDLPKIVRVDPSIQDRAHSLIRSSSSTSTSTASFWTRACPSAPLAARGVE